MIRALLFVALVGCTHQRSITTVHKVSNSWVTVETPQGEVEAFAVRHPTGVLFKRQNGNVVDPSSVIRVTHVQTDRGAIEGYAIGFVLGAAGGAALGYAAAKEDGGDFCILLCSKSEGATLGALGGGLTAGAIGAIVGAIRGSRLVYETRTSSAIKWEGPPGSTAGMTVAF